VDGQQPPAHPWPRPHRITCMSKSEKKNLRYCDYYCFMSLKDFAAWVDADDDREPAMSYAAPPTR